MAAERSPGRGLDLALLVLRLSGLGLLLWHGWGKLARMAGGDYGFVAGVGRLGFPYPTFFAWAAVVAETLLPVLIALGLFTRPAAAICTFNMAVAAFLRHQAHRQGLMLVGLGSYPEEVVKGWGNPELALVYMAVFLALALAGGGRYALERTLRRSRR
ncbi:MAG TPA: DoxX family protein [Vicinamibacteria bacterium]|nr:DoxX family protein [Vicinamibacteria bacterium]